MGYAYYVLPDGREAGYGVSATCDFEGCEKEISRGYDYLCGDYPEGSRPDHEPGCGNYFCYDHEADAHNCPRPMCRADSAYDNLYCDRIRGHEMPHFDSMEGSKFTKTEEDLFNE